MIEVRNDLLTTGRAIADWAQRLTEALELSAADLGTADAALTACT
jgi:predicted N-formylglutamate amidohydrolase